MIIKYAKDCPECLKANKKNSLKRDIDDPEKIFCSEGHSFDEATLQEQEAPAPQEMPTVGPLTPMAPPPPSPIAVGGTRVVPSVVDGAEVKVMPVQSTRTVASIGSGVAIEVLDEPEPVAAPKPPEKPVRELPGGDLEIWVRIPDQHVSFLKAEAENVGETLQQYFQRMLEYGLSVRWFY